MTTAHEGGLRLDPRMCGTPEGLAAHQRAGTQPCHWCIASAREQAAALEESGQVGGYMTQAEVDAIAAAAGAAPEPQRYYEVGGLVIGEAGMNPALQALLDSGEARELTAGDRQIPAVKERRAG